MGKKRNILRAKINAEIGKLVMLRIAADRILPKVDENYERMTNIVLAVYDDEIKFLEKLLKCV